jgi:hypothetical protein
MKFPGNGSECGPKHVELLNKTNVNNLNDLLFIVVLMARIPQKKRNIKL